MTMTKTEIEHIPEYELHEMANTQIAALLAESFQGYPQGRTHYKQMPSFRVLFSDHDELVGHAAVDHRQVSMGGKLYQIFGLADVCVREISQHAGVGSQIMAYIRNLAKEHEIDFLMAFSEDREFYHRFGFEVFTGFSKWLVLLNNHSLGLVNRKIEGSLLVAPLKKGLKANMGDLDLMGTVF